MVVKVMSVGELREAAKREDWDKVDETLSLVCDDPAYVDKAIGDWLPDKDENVRDLGVSLLEKTHSSKFEEIKPQLRKMMREDTNPYVEYRAAFALYAHGDRSIEVIAMLEAAKGDDDVAEIAERYLKDE